MNKKALSVVFVIMVIIGASLAYMLVRKDEGVISSDKNTSSSPPMPPKDQKTEPQPAVKGAYVDYSAELLASTKGTKLLFFHAPWCPQCRELDESIKSSALPDEVTIFKVDYDSNQSLRAKYGVTLQTTVVKVDDNGNKLASYVAYDEPTFQSVSRALLP